jgi:hypothetical protein
MHREQILTMRRRRGAWPAYRQTCVALLGAAVLGGCASGGWFHRGPRPAALVGTWFDSAASTNGDTTLWVLAAGGGRRIVHDVAVKAHEAPGITRQETYADQWYVTDVNVPSRAMLCFVRRARDGATCAHFELDSAIAAASGAKRRLVVHSYDPQSDRKWVLVERNR